MRIDTRSDRGPAQREAVTAPDGPVLVVAGAGSGKTRVLTTRIAWLLDNGVHPGEILAYTFTNKAAREMKERVAAQVGEQRAPFWIGTFHATGARILRTHADRLGLPRGFAIYDSDDQKRLLKNVLADLKIDPKQFAIPGVRQAISKWKNEDDTPEQALAAATRAGGREPQRGSAARRRPARGRRRSWWSGRSFAPVAHPVYADRCPPRRDVRRRRGTAWRIRPGPEPHPTWGRSGPRGIPC